MGSCVCSARKNRDHKNSIINDRNSDKNHADSNYTNLNNNNNDEVKTTTPPISGSNNDTLQKTPNLTNASSLAGVVKFFPLDSLPVETINLLSGKSDLIKIDSECKNEIKLYVSATFADSLFERDNLNSNIFPRLRSYCANKYCDLDVIDLHWHLENIDLINKYLHRSLIKNILNDILVNSKCIFLIFLNESFDKPLCPDRVEKSDYLEIKKLLNQNESELLDSWYKLVEITDAKESTDNSYYELKYFSGLNTNDHVNLNRQEANKQLNKLLDLFQKALNTNHNLSNLKQKYLKSIQEIEVELAIKYLDSNSIIWFQRTSTTTSTIEENLILKSLQLKVFSHNYKNYKIDNNPTTDYVNDNYINILNQFIDEACKKSCDIHIDEFKPYDLFLKLDSSLSRELCKHCEIYAKLNSQYSDHIYSNLNDYLTKINDYIQTNTLKALILYDQIDSNYYDNDLLSKLIAKWINNKNQETDNYSIVYRFCGHTIYSNNLYNLFQSILHQLCFLCEVHESFSFQDMPTLVKNFEKLFDHVFKEEQCKNKIIVVLDRVDNINLNYDSDYYTNDENDKEKNDLLIQLLETFMRILNKHHKYFKLVITLSNNKKSRLLQLFKSILENHNEYSFVQLTGLKESSSTHRSTNSKKLKQKVLEIYSTLTDYFIETPQLVDCLFDYLINSRYGLKESEILDLIYLSSLNLISICKANNLVSNTANSKLVFNYTIYSTTSDINLNFIRSLTPIVWYTFKYNFFQQLKHKLHLFENYIDNNQFFYCFHDLNIRRKFQKYLFNNQNQTTGNNNQDIYSLINKKLLMLDYFNLNINQQYIFNLNKSESSPTKTSDYAAHRATGRKKSFTVLNELKLTPSIDDATTRKLNEIPYQRVLNLNEDKTNVNLITYRMYQEVNLHHFTYHKNQLFLPQSQQEQSHTTTKKQALTEQQLNFLADYLKQFLINFDWFIKKINQTNIWLYIDDLEFYKFYLQQISLHTTTNLKFKQLFDEFNLFEKCLFKILYALNHDISQIYVQLYQAFNLFDVYKHLNSKYFIINEFFVKLKQYFETNFMLYPIINRNNSNNCSNDNDNNDVSLHDNSNIFTFNEPISHYLQKNCVITYVSFVKDKDAYVVTLSKTKNEIKIWNAQTLNIVRTIILNKSPKDIRFIDAQKCVLLLERNLHLFDLNTCQHLNDLKTTMDRNMAFFEVHDEKHIVFMDRNRLSVTLMKLQNEQEQEQLQQQQKVQRLKQFKAGEDRYMNSLMVSKNGKIMVCGDQTQKPFPLIVWNLVEQKLIHDFRQRRHEFITTIQSITTTGKYLICACREETDTRIFLLSYDISSGRLYKKFETNSNFVCVEISEEYNAIVASLENNKILIYDISSENEKYVLNDSKYPVNKIKITQGHRFLTYDSRGYDWTVRLWDLKKGILLCSYTCPSLILSCDINQAGDTISLGLYNNSELYILKLFNNLDSLLKYQSQQEASTIKDENVEDYGDQNFNNKKCEINV